MTRNKCQYGSKFVGMTVKHKKYGLCKVAHEVTDKEYRKLMEPLVPGVDGDEINRIYQTVFTLETSTGENVRCGRDKFTIPRGNKG